MTSETHFVEHTRQRLAAIDEAALPEDLSLVIEQRITDGAVTKECFHVSLDSGVMTVTDGPATNADIVISQDEETARGIRAGNTHAQTAFLTGRLTIDGDVDALLQNAAVLQQLLGAIASHSGDA